MLGTPPVRHWVLVVSLDSRNMSERVDSVLIVPFGSQGAEGPTTLRFEPGETGLPGPSWLKGHFITTLKKSLLGERQTRFRPGDVVPFRLAGRDRGMPVQIGAIRSDFTTGNKTILRLVNLNAPGHGPALRPP